MGHKGSMLRKISLREKLGWESKDRKPWKCLASGIGSKSRQRRLLVVFVVQKQGIVLIPDEVIA